jgi:hypothetical protein
MQTTVFQNFTDNNMYTSKRSQEPTGGKKPRACGPIYFGYCKNVAHNNSNMFCSTNSPIIGDETTL